MRDRNISSRLFDVFIYLVMIFVFVITLYPFLNILAISLNDSIDTVKGGIYLWPRVFTLRNYEEIFKYSNLTNAFKVSVLRTVIGTLLGVLCSMMLAYALSRRDFIARQLFTLLFVLTLYFGGGLIPDFMLIRKLGLINNFWVYILPGLISVWNIIVIRSFMDGIPFSLQESAKLDGANDFQIFLKIVFPLCMPVVATISLFVAVGQWNSWFDTYLYASSREELSTLQYELMKILANTTAGQSQPIRQLNSSQPVNMVSPESIRMAITIIATVPILLVYPFLQKYFVKGLTLGAVKS
ncbi:carbohydrate ABC transporter permease [Petroclostridium xylanilyticum]|uniref:carbohydrate ABC transporter permease n=1 Tax=Petroclostridium xylanilyticum TaxID=1792311 RepID=UPI000B991194|nr:carbohydrate ABC transporter permease [Petroclostridium xylanilyticum]